MNTIAMVPLRHYFQYSVIDQVGNRENPHQTMQLHVRPVSMEDFGAHFVHYFQSIIAICIANPFFLFKLKFLQCLLLASYCIWMALLGQPLNNRVHRTEFTALITTKGHSMQLY